MKRRYAFARFYMLDITRDILPRNMEPRERKILQLYGAGATLELNPGFTIDTQAQRAREHCIEKNHYAFTLHRATKPGHPSKRSNLRADNGYANIIETRAMEIVQWALV